VIVENGWLSIPSKQPPANALCSGMSIPVYNALFAHIPERFAIDWVLLRMPLNIASAERSSDSR
jgi:hypothetical protein